jgi:hypothetical protein
LNKSLANAGFEVIGEGFRNNYNWNPDEKRQPEAIEFGKKIAKA